MIKKFLGRKSIKEAIKEGPIKVEPLIPTGPLETELLKNPDHKLSELVSSFRKRKHNVLDKHL